MRYTLGLLIWLCLKTQPAFADSLLVVTSSQNSNESITKSEAIHIFMGRYRQFSNGVQAKPIDNLAYKNVFYQALVNKTPAEINAYWARLIFSGKTHPPKQTLDFEQTIALLIKEPNAISYIHESQLDKLSPQTKVLLVLEISK